MRHTLLAILGGLSLAFAALTSANDVIVSWDPNPVEDNVKFYTLHVRNANGEILLEQETKWYETGVWVQDLPPGLAIFYVTASNAGGTSLPSEMVVHESPDPAGTLPPSPAP